MPHWDYRSCVVDFPFPWDNGCCVNHTVTLRRRERPTDALACPGERNGLRRGKFSGSDLYRFRDTRRETYTVTVQHKQRSTNVLRYTYNPAPTASLAVHGRRSLEKSHRPVGVCLYRGENRGHYEQF